MATVTIAPPQSPASMTSRRVPLGALPNAPNTINHISYGSLDALKRPRSFNSGQAPPAKKRIVEAPSNPLLRTPVRQTRAEPAVMPPRRATNRTRPARSPQPQPPTLAGNHQREQHELRTQQQTKQRQEQQLAITQREYYRQQQQQQQQEQREQQQNQTGIHTIRAWQRHYRKVFPTIVFYFDSLPDDAALILQKQVQPLGATVEKFFSVAVTHVVTTREIPPEGTVRLATEVPATRTTQSNGTIDPSLLRNHGRELLQSKHDLASRGAQVLRRNKVVNNRTTIHEDGRDRRPARGSSDILVKAREYGMKLWSMDKLQRMMTAMYENEGSQVQAASKILQHQHHAVPEKEINLSHLLRNERLHGPSDRDPKAMSRDMVVFKGPFLYIRDMKSTHRPIMVREYQAVAKREEGDWPQFRSSQTGKCPFIDEHMLMKEREYQREYQREQQALKEATELQARRRAKELEEKLTREKNMQPPRANKQRALDELAPHDNRPNFGRLSAISGQPIPTKLFDVPPVVPAKRQAAREMSNEIAFTSKNGKAAHGQHYQNQKYAYEPAASGVQPSKLTSAIRSNIVSSHLDAPGVKAGLSKDMYELKRKVAGNVMERKPSVSSLAQVHRATDLRTVSSKEELSRNRAEAVVRKPSINEKVEPAMNKVMNADMETDAAGKKAQEVRRWEKEEDRRESRSGYCENCREKFEDLDEHQHSRRHQRFAMNDANFAELDALLSQLQRPLKKQTIRR